MLPFSVFLSMAEVIVTCCQELMRFFKIAKAIGTIIEYLITRKGVGGLSTEERELVAWYGIEVFPMKIDAMFVR